MKIIIKPFLFWRILRTPFGGVVQKHTKYLGQLTTLLIMVNFGNQLTNRCRLTYHQQQTQELRSLRQMCSENNSFVGWFKTTLCFLQASIAFSTSKRLLVLLLEQKWFFDKKNMLFMRQMNPHTQELCPRLVVQPHLLLPRHRALERRNTRCPIFCSFSTTTDTF